MTINRSEMTLTHSKMALIQLKIASGQTEVRSLQPKIGCFTGKMTGLDPDSGAHQVCCLKAPPASGGQENDTPHVIADRLFRLQASALQ